MSVKRRRAFENLLPVLPALPQGGEEGPALSAVDSLCHAGEHRVRSNLKEVAIAFTVKGSHPVRETDREAQVPPPVVCVGHLIALHQFSRQAGDITQARRRVLNRRCNGFELVQNGIQEMRVCSLSHSKRAGLNVSFGKRGKNRFKCFGNTGDHDVRRTVEGRDGNFGTVRRDHFVDSRFVGEDDCHFPGLWQRVHQTPAGADHLQAVVEAEDSGDCCCNIFPDAVPEDRCRSDAP